MPEPTPFQMTKHFSALVGRDVKFEQVPKPIQSKAKQMYGVYNVVPGDMARVVQADLPLLGSFAGALLGLPGEAVKERIKAASMEESFRDAIHEVLNVASTVVCVDHRAIFQKMYTDPAYFPEAAGDTLRSPMYKSYFKVTIPDYDGGAFTLYG